MPEVLATFTPSHRVQHVGTGRDHASDRAEPINHPSNTCCIKPATGTPAAAEASALRKRSKATLTNINGASAKLQKVSDELDKLPDRFLQYLQPTQGTYNCRSIAETKRQSPHSFGIALDIAAAHSHYWLWSKPNPDGRIPYKNEIPLEIVHIFEQHGFIWGGKWYHYDTMHFEYRPEMITIAK